MFAAGNPFITAYLQSDWFGKGIFLALFFLSILCWVILVAKIWEVKMIKRVSGQFLSSLSGAKGSPIEWQLPKQGRSDHPLFEVFRRIKQQSLLILERRQGMLGTGDIEMLESEAVMGISSALSRLERYLFLLPTIASLGPFLGLLGTVWGILISFAELGHARGGQNEMLAGLGTALATTVMGLLIAIPALIGSSYLKNEGKLMRREMEEFSHRLLSLIELEHKS